MDNNDYDLNDINSYISYENICTYLNDQDKKVGRGFCHFCFNNPYFFVKYVYLNSDKEPIENTDEEKKTVLMALVCTNCHKVKKEWILILDINLKEDSMLDVTDKYIRNKEMACE